MQSGQHDYAQGSYPYGYTSALPVTNNGGHDIKQPVAAGQPGMYPNTAQMQSAPQLHQTAMANQVPNPQGNAALSQQMTRGQIQHMQMQYFPRQVIPRSIPNMTRNQVSVVNQGGQQAAQYQQLVVQPNSYPMQALVYQQRPFHPSGNYIYPPNHLYLNNCYAYNNPQATSNGIYPTQPVIHHNSYGMSSHMASQQMQAQPAVQPQPQPQPIRKRNVISIVDPSTMKPVSITSENESSAVSKTDKELENSDSAICVQFATQVAATLNEPSDKSGKSVKSDESNVDSNVVVYPNKTEHTFDNVMGKRVYEADVQVLDQYVKTEDNVVETELTVNYDENCNAPSSEDISGAYKDVDECVNINEQMYESEISRASLQEPCLATDSRVSPLAKIIAEEKLIKAEIDDSSFHIERSPVCHSETIGQEKSSFAPAQLPAFITSPEIPQQIHQVPVSEDASVVLAATDSSDIVPQSADVTECATEMQDASFAASKLPEKENKKNKAKKKKDYNKKGESKEGGDMDAFLDKPEDVPPVSPPVPPSSAPSEQHATITDQTLLDKIPLPGEKPPTLVTAADRAILDNTPLLSSETVNASDQTFGDDSNCPPEPVAEEEVVFENTVELEVSKTNNVLPPEPTESPPDSEPELSLAVDLSDDKENEGQENNKSLNKYNYKEDQWAPFNPEGKKQYDRDFLLQFQEHQMSLCKPLNLPNLDVIKDRPNVHKLNEVNRIAPMIPPVAIKRHDHFLPPYARGGAPGIPHRAFNLRSQQGKRVEKPKIISFQSSLTQSVKLHESENAWKPNHVADPGLPLEELEKEKLKRSVQGVLNKLTPQKFETLVNQLKKLDIDTEEKLKVVIDLIFEKAIDEPNFSVPYASLCKHLALIRVPTAAQQSQSQGVNFRKLLLTKCQKEFEQDKRDQIDSEEKMKEIEEAVGDKKKELQLLFDASEKKIRYRQLGNIRFIGELFKLEMLIEPIMHECIRKLLQQQSDEESLECLCKLLKTIGKELESGKSSKNQQKPTTKESVDFYFAQLQKKVDERTTSSRVRFMLQDVIELRRCKWVPRRDENNPKTIDQIHEDVQREAREQQQLIQNVTPYPKRMPDDRDKRKNAARNVSEEGWTPSKSSKNSYVALDPKMLKLTKQDDVESMRLGPGVRGGASIWSRGSQGGAKAADSTSVQNRFASLAVSEMPAPDPRRESQRSAASSRESSRSRQMPSSVRKSASTSKDRENLLETVKARMSNEPKQSQDVKKPADVHLNGKAADTEESRLRGPEKYTEEDVVKRTKPLVDEFLHNNDSEEAIKCITELCTPVLMPAFISSAINQVLERSTQARLSLGQLLHSLVKRKIISVDSYKEGFVGILDCLEDIAIDVPLIYDYIGELLEPIAVDSELSFKYIKDLIKPCIPSTSAGLIVSAVLHCASKKGTIKLSESWKSSGLSWSEILGSSVDEKEFIEKNKLSFILSPAKVKSDTPLSIAEIQKKLSSLLKTAQNEEIYDWIDANVPQSSDLLFIRALVTEVHSHVISKKESNYELEQTKLKNLTPVLTRYLQHNVNLELQALFAIQVLMNSLDHPSGLLRQIFDMLYDDEVITEEAFRQWEQSEDPNELEGKEVAVHSVKSFFTWLKEDDE